MAAVAEHHHSRLRAAAARYRDARRSLSTPVSAQSRRGLDWMNFFIANVQTGFGTFVAFYLAQLDWSQGHIGVALAAGGMAGVVSQIPDGALADAVTWKRGLAALGILMTGAAALILAFAPNFPAVFLAELLQGGTAGIITPAVGAVGTMSGIAASVSMTATGFLFQAFGPRIGYLPLAAIAVAATALLWVFLTETKPPNTTTENCAAQLRLSRTEPLGEFLGEGVRV